MSEIGGILFGITIFAFGIFTAISMYDGLYDKDDFWIYVIVCIFLMGILVGTFFLHPALPFLIITVTFILLSVPKLKTIFSKFIYVGGIVFIVAFTTFMSGIMIYALLGFNSESSENKEVNFAIENYEVTLDVGIDNKVDVTEKIGILFYGSKQHGIYKFTPEWLEYTGKDGKTIKRKSKVLNYRAEHDNYVIDVVKKKQRIKIGDINRTVSGEKTYVIKYTYDMGRDPFKNFDEFIFHAFGEYWGTSIKNPKIIINMPKGIEPNDINVFCDKYRKEICNDYMNVDTSSNSVTITSKDNRYVIDGALTVDIELPENYFEGGSYNYGWTSFIISMVIFGLLGVVIYLWAKYGKDKEKRMPTVEFYAPDRLNAAEIGYLFNKKRITKKLTISLLIQLASKGYLRIDEEKGKRGKENNIVITKLNDDITTLSECELTVYENLFKSKNVVKLANHDDFYKAFEAVNKILKTKFEERVYDQETKKPRIITLFITTITMALSIISFFIVEDMNPELSILYYASFGCIVLDLCFAIIMGRKTEYGEDLSARIRGFRNFLITVEKPQLESLVEQNPKYFYDILPYTYVLNVSKKWIEKFEKIPIEKQDMGHFDYYNGDVFFSDISSCVHYPSAAVSSKGGNSSGGCSSCGGGCSSCGGGCSSCGGGGSW